MPSIPEEIKSAIVSHPNISLGSFIDDRKVSRPGIWIQGNQIPDNWKRKGLVIIIQEIPVGQSQPTTGGRFKDAWFTLRIIQYDDSKGIPIDELEDLFPNSHMIAHELATQEIFESYLMGVYAPYWRRAL